ncbi:sugar transferase [Kallotenue papyrolyticum]|uniref:sugar transferase n=1 Tax=Kallotenue papyrolyticum TaxID=1325125 RepID=UPI000492BAFB|nr:sugar transferase [Kallotenue papyrolyticum]
MFERLGRRLAGSVLIWTLVLTCLALRSTTWLRLWLAYGHELTLQQARIPWPLYGVVVVVWTIVFLLLHPQRALFSSPLVETIGRLVAAVTLSVLIFAGILYFSFRDISRLQFLYFASIDLVLLLVFYTLVRMWLEFGKRHIQQRRTLIVGDTEEVEQLVRELERRPWVGIEVIGYTSDQPGGDTEVPCLGHIDETVRVVKEQAIDEVIFVTQQQEQIVRISMQLVHEPVMIHMVPRLLDLAFARTPIETLGRIPLISLRESALTEPQRALKRLFDIVGSLLLLILFSPLMLLIAIAIKLDSPGPVLFLQERIGEHGRRFKMIKFRTMYQDAEHRWQEVAQRNAHGQLIHKRENDPRITRVGLKLRRTSLDELPQLFNVLRGEMSLVGPRPEIPYIAQEEYEPWQWQRFRVPPGITGWWQVNGRSNKVMHLHTAEDLYYIQNYSFWLDLKILWMTLGAVLRRQGAF